LGKAVILQNLGEGLYKARPLYDMAPLNAELAKLEAAQAEYAALLIRALNSLDLLRRDTIDASSAKNLVLQQWLDEVISKTNPVPPVIPPPIVNDPETGLPWVDPDRAQEEPLLALVNALRSSASAPVLTRDDDLDAAALTHLRNQAATGRIGHFGAYQSKPADRVLQQGYNAESVTEVLSYGATSPDDVVSEWQKDPDTVADLLTADATAAGVAYKYAPTHPHTHLWCLLIVKPGSGPPPVSEITFPPDPAKDQAENQEQGLERIELPRHDPDAPPKLGEAVQKYAIAVNKERAAEKELARLMAEKLERNSRIIQLQAIKTELEQLSWDVWCCNWKIDLTPGQQVETFEVPGFLEDSGVYRTTLMKEDTPQQYTVSYFERSWNIAPFGTGNPPHGQLRHAESMTPSAVFYNAAIEPGHLKWRPLCRYGTITELSGNVCTVSLIDVSDVPLTGEADELPLNATTTLTGVPIQYAPCHQWAFEVGDEVLVIFVGLDRTKPMVVGFKREPRNCQGRIGWIQVGF
jgi:uncharacterized protein YkwD